MFPDCLKRHDKSYRATILVDVTVLLSTYHYEFDKIQKEHLIQDDDYEEMYDWLVIEAFSNAYLQPHAKVHGHHKHDVYKTAGYALSLMFEAHIRLHPALRDLDFKETINVKAIVAGPNLIIVTQRNMYE